MADLIAPLTQKSQHEVLNGFFALDAQTGARGLLVSPASPGWVSTNAAPTIASNLSTYGGATSPRWATPAKVSATASGVKPFGVSLTNVLETDPTDGSYLWNKPSRLAALSAVCSGQTIEILRKGEILYHVGTGVTCFNSGAAVSNTTAGALRITANKSEASVFGTFLGNADDNGYALLSINCY